MAKERDRSAPLSSDPLSSDKASGGKLKPFTMDFEGRAELRIPLIVTSKIESEQHFALCVRNMFEEERVTMPGLLTVSA